VASGWRILFIKYPSLWKIRELLEQWITRLQTLLSLDKKQIGVIGGGKDRRTGIVDVAILQSLNRKGEIKPFIEDYGQVIVDECHHISAFSFEQVLKALKAKYVLGLTATPTRKDGHHPIVFMQCGPIRMRIDAKSQISVHGFEHVVIPRYTNFKLENDAPESIQNIYGLLIQDEARNEMIFDDVLRALEEGRTPILLTGRVAHVDALEKRLTPFVKNVIVLRSGLGRKRREALQKRIVSIPENEERVYIATGKLIGEGFDEPRLDTLFLVHPISWRGTLEQYVGRLHRKHPSKTSVQVYDYVDVQVPQLLSMFRKRVAGYRAMGYSGV